MNGEKIKKHIVDWERRFPVNEWQIQGIHIWPYIRIKLYFFLLNINNDTSYVSAPAERLKRSRATIIFKVIKRLVKAKIELHDFYDNLMPRKILFFGSHFHRTRHNNLFFNRFFDPMIDAHNLQDEVYTIEFGKVYNQNYNQQAIIPLHKYLDQFKLLGKVGENYKSRVEPASELKDFRIFYNELMEVFPLAQNLHISLDALKNWAKKINRTKDFFIKMFKKTRPEKIIFLSYYGYDDLAAAILAANNLGIKTIDFQHGPQTNVHMAYSSWTKHPEKFFNTMPVEYWTWDERSKQNIEEWTQKSAYIKARNFGHPYLSYFSDKLLHKIEESSIIFSLQTLRLTEMLPSSILGLIRGHDIKWIFRMHPRSNFSIEDLASYLEDNDIPKSIYSIEDSVHSPLPQSLAGARLHVTNFSGCVLEAGIMNIPSLIIHESGKEIFKNYIDNENVFYLDCHKMEFEKDFINIWNGLPDWSSKHKFKPIQNPLSC